MAYQDMTNSDLDSAASIADEVEGRRMPPPFLRWLVNDDAHHQIDADPAHAQCEHESLHTSLPRGRVALAQGCRVTFTDRLRSVGSPAQPERKTNGSRSATNQDGKVNPRADTLADMLAVRASRPP